LKTYADEDVDFSETDTNITTRYIESVSEVYDENTKKYIDYVDTAKDQFIELISYQEDCFL
jgi:hypothetical protein